MKTVEEIEKEQEKYEVFSEKWCELAYELRDVLLGSTSGK